MAGFNQVLLIQRLAVPAVSLLIAFLAYSSQYLFYAAESLEPGPLTRRESITFNTLLVCLWWTYFRACTVHPGSYKFPRKSSGGTRSGENGSVVASGAPGTRWCKKCSAPKPPRAHHCRHCKRCIPKMDHHCPWTANCVSLTTFPHFLRFLIYTNLSLWTLGYFLYQRFAALWASRALPAYLGPSLPALIHLAVLLLVCFFTSLALGILLITTTHSWLFNRTMIEGWEVERHEVVVSKGQDWLGSDQDGIGFEAVEFPYDIGIFRNMAQAMGTTNVLWWVFPLASGPSIALDGVGTGWTYEENGFNPNLGMWPPPDPEKMRTAARGGWPGAGLDSGNTIPIWKSMEEEKAAFKARQEADMQRWQKHRLGILAELEEIEDYDILDGHNEPEASRHRRIYKAGWTNSEGQRLRDYGVDEEAEVGDVAADTGNRSDEDVPLGDLIRRRKISSRDPI